MILRGEVSRKDVKGEIWKSASLPLFNIKKLQKMKTVINFSIRVLYVVCCLAGATLLLAFISDNVEFATHWATILGIAFLAHLYRPWRRFVSTPKAGMDAVIDARDTINEESHFVVLSAVPKGQSAPYKQITTLTKVTEDNKAGLAKVYELMLEDHPEHVELFQTAISEICTKRATGLS